MINRVFILLNTKTAAVLCLAIAIASRIINVLFVSYAGRDKMILVMQSRSFLEGKGWVIPQYFISNPDVIVYDATPYWPPGYPIALAPFLKIFEYNIYNATTALDIIVCVGLIFIVRTICKQTGFSTAAINIATLLTGCFEYSFIHESLPTDTISLLFLLIGFSFLLKSIQKENHGLSLLLTTGFFLFLPNLFRYAYPVVSVGLPLMIILTGLLQKQKSLIKKGTVLIVTVSTLLALFYLILQEVTGSPGYVLTTEKGFYPENLVHWYPVIPASFINISFLSSQLLKYFGTGAGSLLQVLEWINIISVILICAWLFSYFRRKKFTPVTTFDWFLLLGFFSGIFVFVSLGYLSFTYKIQSGFVGGWNYIYESRYYALVFIFIQLCFIAALLKNRFAGFILLRPAIVAASIILVTEIAHNLYFNTKVALSFDKYKSSVYREQDYNYFTSLIGELENENPGSDIFVTAYKDNFYPYTATYLGHKGFADAITLNETLPSVKRNTFLVLMIYAPDIPLFEKFMSANPVKKIKQVDYSHFYLLELNP